MSNTKSRYIADDIELYHGDCLEVMPALADGIVDCVIADLPYGTTACKWDNVIPFEPLWAQLKRICKGAIVLFGSEPFSSMQRLSNIKGYKYDWIWEKPQGVNPFNAKKTPMRNYENICVFGFGRTLYNPQMSNGRPYRAFNSDKGEYRWAIYGGKQNFHNANNGTRYPKSVLKFRQVQRGTAVHPTQKPIALLEYLIRTYTNEGDTVLDCAMGSGSTMVACVNTGCKGIGIELMEEYYNIAVKRVSDATAQKRSAI